MMLSSSLRHWRTRSHSCPTSDAGPRYGDPSANVTSALAGRFSDATQDAIVLAFCNSEFCIDAISGAGITRE